MLAVVLDRLDIAVQTDLETRIGLAADGRRDEYRVPPDDGTRESEARDRRLPDHVRAVGDIPRRRERKAFGDARGGNSAELRPVDTWPGGAGRCQPPALNRDQQRNSEPAR